MDIQDISTSLDKYYRESFYDFSVADKKDTVFRTIGISEVSNEE